MDKYAVCIKKEDKVVGHLRKQSFFLTADEFSSFFIFILFIEYLYRVFTLQKIYTKIKFLLSTCALVIIKDKILKALKEK